MRALIAAASAGVGGAAGSAAAGVAPTHKGARAAAIEIAAVAIRAANLPLGTLVVVGNLERVLTTGPDRIPDLWRAATEIVLAAGLSTAVACPYG